MSLSEYSQQFSKSITNPTNIRNRPQSAQIKSTNRTNEQVRPETATVRTEQPSNEDRPETGLAQQLKKTYRSPQFIGKQPNKEMTHPYFKESKVAACVHVTLEGGVPKAVPFYSKPSLTYAEKMVKMGLKESLSQEQFKLKSTACATSHNKPLSRYDPNAQRNQLAQPAYKMPRSNVSQISFGNEKILYKSSSTYGNLAKVGFCSNPQILAHKTSIQQTNIRR